MQGNGLLEIVDLGISALRYQDRAQKFRNDKLTLKRFQARLYGFYLRLSILFLVPFNIHYLGRSGIDKALV